MNALGLKSSPGQTVQTGDRVLLLGLGNDLLTDDAVGLHLAREVRQRLAQSCPLHIDEVSEMGLSLLDYVVGYDELVLLDAVQTGLVPPGFLHEFGSGQLERLPTRTPHAFGLGEVLAFGQQVGLAVPKRVRILAVEVQDPFTVGTEMTPGLRQAMPGLVDQVFEALQKSINLTLGAGR